MVERGDLIVSRGERGVVCQTTPYLVMVPTAFHSYVPVLDEYVIIQAGYDVSCCIRPEVMQRICRYMESIRDAPTGSP